MRLSPGDYVFTVAPLQRPLGIFDRSGSDVPKDLYLPGSKWFFVEAVALTSGGGSYRDIYKDGVQTHAIGTSISALWAKAKADISPEQRPFKVGDYVVRLNPSSESDKTPRLVREVDDTDRCQFIWLEPAEGCHHFTNDGYAWGFKLAGVAP